ncbi:cell division protein ZapE [Microbacterium sp. No. 7]|uniref:cell division protein ZapE n=1 Tax=Microbacterium sp. No. 7 TaxID=1714373 RepID=UPI0006ED0697|nr:cell division protein ZapE [Microbacterium sp. No. 7]ALJ20215.1 hypothetical protein AOA12_09940 [Microbacterium sp. No. 7]
MRFRRRGSGPEGQPSSIASATSPRFLCAVHASGLAFDEAQRSAIARLAEPPTHGFYLWGPVGRGKSVLLDLYYGAVPTSRKRRFHFHDFFRDLQAEIAAARKPVEASIGGILGSARVVLFDEFHVHDVADAVYLTTTLEVLAARGILLLATSNDEPRGLMPNPLFHERFLPAIALIESRLDVVSIGSGRDYRRDVAGGSGFGGGSWEVDAGAPGGQPAGGVDLTINGLVVRAAAADGTAATFTFAELCDRPLGTGEYLRLADRFARIRVLAVPDLSSVGCDPLTRLCRLVDVLYDRDRRLDVRAAGAPRRMLDAREPPLDAARTLSRLAMLEPRREGAGCSREGAFTGGGEAPSAG